MDFMFGHSENLTSALRRARFGASPAVHCWASSSPLHELAGATELGWKTSEVRQVVRDAFLCESALHVKCRLESSGWEKSPVHAAHGMSRNFPEEICSTANALRPWRGPEDQRVCFSPERDCITRIKSG